jgi:hypothetical protein
VSGGYLFSGQAGEVGHGARWTYRLWRRDGPSGRCARSLCFAIRRLSARLGLAKKSLQIGLAGSCEMGATDIRLRGPDGGKLLRFFAFRNTTAPEGIHELWGDHHFSRSDQ